MYICLLIVLGRIANEIANEKVSKSIEYENLIPYESLINEAVENIEKIDVKL